MRARVIASALAVALLLLIIGLAPTASAQSQAPSSPIPPRPAGHAASQEEPPNAHPGSSAATLNAQEVAGWLNLIWGDSAPGQLPRHSLLYRLTDDEGREYELLLGEGAAVNPGDLLLLNGKRVLAGGQTLSAPNRPGEPTTLRLSSIAADPDGAVAPDVAGNSPWVSLMCKFSDVGDEPHDQQYFEDMYGTTQPGLDHYWREVSYNKVNIEGSGAFGWYTLPHPRSYYVDDDAGVTDLNALAVDCIGVADADVYYPDYVGINLMFNDWLGCCAWGGGRYMDLDGVEQHWSVTWEPPWAYSDISVIYHEMGHGFGLPHSSGDYGYVYDNVWDVMSADRYNCYNDDEHMDPVYGCLGQNTIAFHHDLLGWIASEQFYLADLGNHSLTLEQIDQPATTNYLVAKIPIEQSSNHFFTVEVRRLVGYDAKLPDSAVVIHEVNLNWSEPAHVVDIDYNEDTSDEGAMWRVGEQFSYNDGEITVTVDAATTTGFEITIENNSAAPFDPYEPDDTPEEATPIAYGDELTGALIQVPGDEDWYVFQGNADDEIELHIDAGSLGSSMYPSLNFYQEVDGELVLLADGYYDADIRFSWYLQESGEYYVQIRDYDHPDTGGSEYFYDLSLYLAPPWQYVNFPAVADAFVNQAAKTTNYGALSYLRVKNAASDMNSYLKFYEEIDVPVGLCLRESSTSLSILIKEPSTDFGNIYAVDSGWTENAITWNNAPPILGRALASLGPVSDESTWSIGLQDYPATNGWHSFAIRNGSSNSVDFSSRQGQRSPALQVWYQLDATHKPHAYFYTDRYRGLVPVTVTFSDVSSGCPSSWFWDFGDGTTSAERHPTHTFTSTGWFYTTLTVENEYGSHVRGRWIYVAEPPGTFYISPAANATIGGIPAQGADILRYVKAVNGWTMVYDGSAHGTLKNIGSFAFDDDGNLLLVFSSNQLIPGLGTATPRDVVRFTPDTPWSFPLSSGSWSWRLRGSWANVGLTTAAEAIDALSEPWSDLAVSTTGAAALPTNPILRTADEDIIWWLTWDGVWGNWLEIDGSQVPGLAAEDVNGLWYDQDVYDYYLTILGPFNLGGVVGDGRSIVRLTYDHGWQTSLVPWLAPGAVFPSTIDAIELAR